MSTSIRLRAIEPEDLDLIYKVENDITFWRHGTSTVPYSRYTLKQYIASSQNNIFADGQVRLVIETIDGQSIGLADLYSFDPTNLRAEVGILLLPPFQGKGLGSETLRQLAVYARLIHLHQLWATIAISNKAAEHAFAHAGFKQKAYLSDWLRQADSFVDAAIWQLML